MSSTDARPGEVDISNIVVNSSSDSSSSSIRRRAEEESSSDSSGWSTLSLWSDTPTECNGDFTLSDVAFECEDDNGECTAGTEVTITGTSECVKGRTLLLRLLRDELSHNLHRWFCYCSSLPVIVVAAALSTVRRDTFLGTTLMVPLGPLSLLLPYTMSTTSPACSNR